MLQPIGNCSFDVFRWLFCEKFGMLLTYTHVRIRRNLARVGTRRRWRDRCTCTWRRSWSRCASECGRWWRSGRDGGAWDCRKNSERFRRFEVWKSFGRICHRFGRIWIGRVRAGGTFLRITVFILRERIEECLQTRAVFFLECWQVSLKFLRLVPIQLGRGERVYSPTLSTRPNPTPQLTKNFVECWSECRKLFFLRLRDNCFLHGNRFKTWVIMWIFFTPNSLRTHHLCVCVSIAQKIKIHTGKMPKWLIIYFAPLSIQKVKN